MTQFLEKYTSHSIWKVCVSEGVGETELQHIDPHSIGHYCVSLPFSWAAQPGTWEPSLPGTCSHSSIFSPTRLISILINRGHEGSLCWVMVFSTASYLQLVWSPNWLNFLCTSLYNSSTSTFFLRASQIALIQPIHGQGYTLIFLERMHLLFTQLHFLFWQPGQVVGQYTTVWLSTDRRKYRLNLGTSAEEYIRIYSFKNESFISFMFYVLIRFRLSNLIKVWIWGFAKKTCQNLLSIVCMRESVYFLL